MKTIKLNANQSLLIQTLVTKRNFYAEPGFSDVTPQEVIEMLDGKMEATTVKRTLTSLYRKGLFFTDFFEHNEINQNNRWVKVSYTIIYLSEGLYHMVDWDKNYYGTSDVQDIELIYTNEQVTDKEVKPTGERGQLTPMGQGEFTVNNALGRESAIIEALKVTDMKNAKTAMNKFIKSNRTTARYYGVTLVKK